MTRDELLLVQYFDRVAFYNSQPIKVIQLSYPWKSIEVALVRDAANPKARLQRVGFDELTAEVIQEVA